MKNVIFIAPPAAGKGTQSAYLEDLYHYTHISTGDILRDEVKMETDLGKKIKEIMEQGQFVSDEVMIDLIKKTLSNCSKPFVLDGFPRTLEQAQALDKLDIQNYIVIYLKVSEDIAMKRALGRMSCPQCKKTYNIYFDNLKPRVDGICDSCSTTLIKRSDDNGISFKTRFNKYLSETKPIIDFYQNKNLLASVNAENDEKQIFSDIIDLVK